MHHRSLEAVVFAFAIACGTRARRGRRRPNSASFRRALAGYLDARAVVIRDLGILTPRLRRRAVTQYLAAARDVQIERSAA